MKSIDIQGQRFGMLTVKERVGSHTDKSALWLCACDCGGTIKASSTALRGGDRTTCGCTRNSRDPARKFSTASCPERGQRAGQVTKRRLTLDEAFAEIRSRRT